MTRFEDAYPLAGRNSNPISAAPPPSAPATPQSGVPLDELRDRWIRFLDVAPSSVETYTKASRQFLRWLHELGITNPSRTDILAYKRHLETSKKPTTAKLYLIAVRQFFTWLEAEDAYKNVALRVKCPKVDPFHHRRDYLTPDQVKAVLNKINRQTESDLRDYAVLLLMVTCGLRRIEVCRANVEDIRAVGISTRLYIQGKGKADKDDYVKIPTSVEQAIREYLAKRDMRPRSPTPLFTSISRNSAGRRLSTRFISEIVKTRLQMAGYDSDRLCAHSLRHTAVTLALQAGQPLQEVQQFARHASIVTTMVYAHNVEKENNNCAQAIERAIS
jgi:integrase/recombinase XerC